VVEKVKGSTMLKESDGDPRVIVRPDIKKGDSVLIQQGFGPYGGKRGKVVDIVKMIRSQIPNTAMFAKGISVPPQAVIQIPEIEMDIQIPISKLSKI
jgi:ribosomal protein L24